MLKIIIISLFFITFTYACSGDCLSCHPALKKSINNKYHKILKTCITCHNTLPEAMTTCGGDCFSCHSQNELIKSNLKEHQQLDSCKQCHINKEDILKFNNDFENNLLDKLSK